MLRLEVLEVLLEPSLVRPPPAQRPEDRCSQRIERAVVVDEVDQDVPRRGRCGDLAIYRDIVRRSDDQPDVIQPVFMKFVVQVHDAPLRRTQGELLRQSRRAHADTRTRSEQGSGLARSDIAATYHENAAIGQVRKQRI